MQNLCNILGKWVIKRFNWITGQGGGGRGKEVKKNDYEIFLSRKIGLLNRLLNINAKNKKKFEIKCLFSFICTKV